MRIEPSCLVLKEEELQNAQPILSDRDLECRTEEAIREEDISKTVDSVTLTTDVGQENQWQGCKHTSRGEEMRSPPFAASFIGPFIPFGELEQNHFLLLIIDVVQNTARPDS